MNPKILKCSLLIVLIVSVSVLAATPFLVEKAGKWNIASLTEWLRLPSFHSDISQDLKVPTLKEQPRDTQITTEGLPIHYWQTANGVSVYFVPTEGLPMLDIQLSLRVGSAHDGDRPGMTSLLASLLDEGTGELKADDLAEQIEGLGSSYGFDVDRDRTVLAFRSLTEKDILNTGVALFSRMVTEPSMHAEAIERMRAQSLAALNQQALQPASVAYQALLKGLYGQHPYNHPALGNREAVAAITPAELQAFHKKYYVAENAVIAMVGGVHRDLARELSEKIARSLPKGEKNPEVVDVSPLKEAVNIQLPFAAAQSQILVAQLGRVAGDADLFALTVGNHILGGQDTSRLYKEIREDKGWVYGVSSNFERALRLAPFYIGLQTAPNKAQEAEVLVKQILTKFVSEGPSDQELLEAKRYIAGSFPLSFSSNGQTISLLSDYAFYNLPKDFFNTYQKNIESVTREDVKKAFEKHIPLNTLVTVVLGNTS